MKKIANELFKRQFNVLDLIIVGLVSIQFNKGNLLGGGIILVMGIAIIIFLEELVSKK